MHTKDLTWGVMLLALAACTFYIASSFPTLPKQIVGAGTFPMLVSALLALCGAALIISAITAAPANSDNKLQITSHGLISLYLLGAVPLSCAYLSELIGFTLAAALPTSALMFSLRRGKLIQSSAITLSFCAFIFFVFTKGLLVPLAHGPLGTIIGI